MTTNRMHDELACQIDAIAELHPQSEEMKLWIAEHFGGIWRDVINSFEANFDRVPSGHDLVYILGKTLNMDPCEVVRGEGMVGKINNKGA